MSVSMSSLTVIFVLHKNQSSLCMYYMLEPCEIWEMIQIRLSINRFFPPFNYKLQKIQNKSFNLADKPLLQKSFLPIEQKN
jgi:hypothetical protein